ncbi:MAG TPA: hypothetical protein VNW99_03610, partial [Cytophagaceae bacterium]|nr:hypothetical protein [Cytophagaceae bacterium]
MKKKYFILHIFLSISLLVYGQNDSINLIKNPSSKDCNPMLAGMAPSKGFSISYERVGNSHIKSVS